MPVPVEVGEGGPAVDPVAGLHREAREGVAGGVHRVEAVVLAGEHQVVGAVGVEVGDGGGARDQVGAVHREPGALAAAGADHVDRPVGAAHHQGPGRTLGAPEVGEGRGRGDTGAELHREPRELAGRRGGCGPLPLPRPGAARRGPGHPEGVEPPAPVPDHHLRAAVSVHVEEGPTGGGASGQGHREAGDRGPVPMEEVDLAGPGHRQDPGGVPEPGHRHRPGDGGPHAHREPGEDLARAGEGGDHLAGAEDHVGVAIAVEVGHGRRGPDVPLHRRGEVGEGPIGGGPGAPGDGGEEEDREEWESLRWGTPVGHGGASPGSGRSCPDPSNRRGGPDLEPPPRLRGARRDGRWSPAAAGRAPGRC